MTTDESRRETVGRTMDEGRGDGTLNTGVSNRPWRTRLAQSAARLRADLTFAAIDAVIVVFAYMAALVLRFVDLQTISPKWWQGFLISLPIVMIVHLSANFLFGAYGHVWEYASVEEAMRLVFAALSSAVLLLGGLLAYRTMNGGTDGLVPIMVLAVGAGFTLAGMGVVRFRSRMFSFKRTEDLPEPASTLIVGTGRAGVDIARHGMLNGTGSRVVGFVAIQGRSSNLRLAGLPVLGGLEELPAIVQIFDIDQVVIATPLADDQLRDLVDGCMSIDVRLRIVPGLEEVLGANGSLRDVRDLELTDLLPRETVETDLASVASLLVDRRVMVTGAGGSIGTEIVRQVLAFQPSALYALDNDETHLYEASLSWQNSLATPLLCDIRDEAAVERLFDVHQPEIVFHAAAHKHVPILEAFPEEAEKTNIRGTRNVLNAVKAHGVERFVLISTDKAVDPTSVMGASKRVAEMLVQATVNRPDTCCIHSAVRFGNVLGSRGSVVPTFMRQIQAGGPVTVSDPEMLRYFMTVAEAVQLVLQSAAMADGGEVFVLDMGEPIRIGDLAHRMIRLAGLVPGRDIDVVVTGARPGEKHTEVLSRHPLVPSMHPKINKVMPDWPEPIVLFETLRQLEMHSDLGDREEVRKAIHGLAWQHWSPEVVVDLRDPVDHTSAS